MTRPPGVAVLSIAAVMACHAGGARSRVLAQEMKSQWDGVYSTVQAERGRPLYSQSCGACHGGTLLGGDRAPALAGPGFAGRWSDRSLGDLFEYMSVMMPLQSPGGFSAQQNADILAFMLSRGNYPAGQSDLPAQIIALAQIKILAAKK